MRPRCSLAGVLFILPVLLVLLTASSSTAPSASEDEAKERFTLAVLRRDSIAIPFATYDGKRWKNSWPKPESRVTAPIALADVPKRWWTGRDPILKWTLWPLDPPDSTLGTAADAAAADTAAANAAAGGARAGGRTLETIGPTWFPAHCHQSLGLRTTFSTREVVPPPHVQPYPKAGLAIAGDAAIVPIEIIDIASSPLVDPLARTLVKSVNDEETRLIRNYIRASLGWSHPYNDEERKEMPFRIEAMYKVARGLGDRDVYYYEGLKHYAVREPVKNNEPAKKNAPDTEPQARTQPSSQSQEIAGTPGTSQNLQSAASTPASQNSQGSQKLPSTPQGATAAATANAAGASAASGASGKGPGQEPCDLVTFVSGWLIGREQELLEDKERIKPLQVNVTVTSCDFEAANIMLPLGAVRVKDRTVWAVQWSGWTHEHYAIVDVKEEQVSTLLASDGGWCPKR